MGILKNGIKELNKVSSGLKTAENKQVFLWNFLEGQLMQQNLDNLINFRKRLNRIIMHKFKELEMAKKK